MLMGLEMSIIQIQSLIALTDFTKNASKTCDLLEPELRGLTSAFLLHSTWFIQVH